MTVAPFSKVGPAIAAAMVGAFILDKTIASIFGHEKPSTFSPAYQTAMAKRYMCCEREGAPDSPVVLDPISRGIPPAYKPHA